jgi:hypothetical protein
MISNDFEGICLMTTAACTNHQGLYVQRFFLGALESGVSPAWMLVVGGKSSPYHVENSENEWFIDPALQDGTRNRNKPSAWACGTR